MLCLLCCIALCFKPLCCVAYNCVVLRSIVLSVLLHCIALCCDPLCRCCVVSVELHSVVLCCDPLCCVVDKFSISSIPSMLTLYISRHTQPTSLTGRQSLHQRTRQTQPPLPNRKTQHLSLILRQYEPHYATNSTNSTTLTQWQKKSPHFNTTRQTKRPLPNKLNNPHLL